VAVDLILIKGTDIMNMLKSYLSILFVICYVFSSAVMAQSLPETLREIVAPGTGTNGESNLVETLKDLVAPGTGTTTDSDG
jgi:hypothetical protein